MDKNVLIWKDQWNEIRLKERMDLVDDLKIKESILILILKIIKIKWLILWDNEWDRWFCWILFRLKHYWNILGNK